MNGVKVLSRNVPRSAATALRGARSRGDERLIDAAEIGVDVPATPDAIAVAERAFNELTPTHAEGTLSLPACTVGGGQLLRRTDGRAAGPTR